MKPTPNPTDRLHRVKAAAKRLRAQGWSAEDLQAISLEVTGLARLEHLTLCSREVLDLLAKRFEALIVQTPLEWCQNGGRERQWAANGRHDTRLCDGCGRLAAPVRRISGSQDRLCAGCYQAELDKRKENKQSR